MIRFVLGLDIGYDDAPTGGALLDFGDSQPRILQEFVIPGMPVPARLPTDAAWQLRQQGIVSRLIREVLDKADPWPHAVVYELAHIGQNPQTGLRLNHLAALIGGVAAERGLAYIGVQPAAAKAALASNSAASKGDMITAARRLYGMRSTSSHVADGVGVALAGEALLRQIRVVLTATTRR